MKNKFLTIWMLLTFCFLLTACGERVVKVENISSVSEADLEGIEYITVFEAVRSEDGRYCVDVYTSTDENGASYILPLADDFYGETQTFGVVGARSLTQYFNAKDFYENWWKAGIKNDEFVYNTRFSYRLNELGEITYLSEYDFYADNDVTTGTFEPDDEPDLTEETDEVEEILD